ncbi:E3 ubiquitin-protein ligase MBR2 [Camellia lanceoleosa]|uniref:E3 ubiquitin-protein ligase MBR2 n=1 Tax=Camellia lanceoleosa TaxID=1840588 RepID=A0ACC0HVW8_9ERIC|nr:E3 ubiquitin-protein ligase MBR2 [Camellia lanceoleosa]
MDQSNAKHRWLPSPDINIETTQSLEEFQTFERNTRQRINLGSEEEFPSSSMSSFTHVGSTLQTLQPSISIVNPGTGSTSYVPPIIPASGADTLQEEENPAEGPIGYHQPTPSTYTTMSGILVSRPGNQRAIQAVHSTPRVVMIRAEGQNAVIHPMLVALEQFIVDPRRIRMVRQAWEILQQVGVAALQNEDSMIVGPMFNEPDVHEDMRLDVDNMTYEELLSLEEQIGNMNTGLSEDAILGGVKQHRHQSMKSGQTVLCLSEEYVDEEDLGKLDCGHQFHLNCIKQWLIQKNSCPIYKRIALAN